MTTTLTATTTTLQGLGFSFDDTIVESPFSSSQESFNSLFSEADRSSHTSQTDPGSPATINSSDEDGATIYSDEDLEINHFNPYLGLSDDAVEVADYIPWPSPELESDFPRRRGSSSSFDIEAVDRGYETDAEDDCDTTFIRTRPRRKTRRSRVHYLVEHKEPISNFEVIIPFTEEEKRAYYLAQAQAGSSPVDGVLDEEHYVSHPPTDYDPDLVDDSDDGPVEYVVEHVRPIVAILPALTTTTSERELAGLGLGLPSFDEPSRLTRPARLAVNGSVAEMEIPQGRQTMPATTTSDVQHQSYCAIAGLVPRPSNLGRSASFESVDLSDVDVDGFEVVSAPHTPDLHPGMAGGESPSPVLLSSPAIIISTSFRIADAPELGGAIAPMQIAMAREPRGDEEM